MENSCNHLHTGHNRQHFPTHERRRSSSFSNLIGQQIVTSYLSTAKQREEAERRKQQASSHKNRRGWLSPSFKRRLTASKSDDEGVRSMRRMTMALKPSEDGLLMWVSGV